MAGMRSQLAAAVAVLTLLASVAAVYAQMGDPCNNPDKDKDYDLLQGPPTTFQGILEGRLQERFYRFKNLNAWGVLKHLRPNGVQHNGLGKHVDALRDQG
jgi:hypothetical protein